MPPPQGGKPGAQEAVDEQWPRGCLRAAGLTQDGRSRQEGAGRAAAGTWSETPSPAPRGWRPAPAGSGLITLCRSQSPCWKVPVVDAISPPQPDGPPAWSFHSSAFVLPPATWSILVPGTHSRAAGRDRGSVAPPHFFLRQSSHSSSVIAHEGRAASFVQSGHIA